MRDILSTPVLIFPKSHEGLFKYLKNVNYIFRSASEVNQRQIYELQNVRHPMMTSHRENGLILNFMSKKILTSYQVNEHKNNNITDPSSQEI